MKKTGKAGLLVALCGVLKPLGLGTLLAYIGARTGLIEKSSMISYIFVGTVLTATSVSITVETLKELGKLNTLVGNTILAAALIDDVLGLVALTVISSFVGENVNVGIVLLKIVLFFVFAIVVGVFAKKFFDWMISRKKEKKLLLLNLLQLQKQE